MNAHPSRMDLRHWVVLCLAAFVVAAFVIPTWSEAYIDFGDGNYLYISSRIAEGAVVYRDILAPQPPCHLILGAALVRLSPILGLESPLFLIRAISLLMHLACGGLVVWIGCRAWKSPWTAVASGIIYVSLPLNFWWAMGWQSEPLEIFFLLLMLQGALRESRSGDLAAGVFAALAAMTNLTAAPFLLVLIVFMLVRDSRRAFRMAIPALALAAVITISAEIWTGGMFLRNAVLNQVGTYPPDRFLSYALGKIIREGGDMLWQEGVFIFLAAFGFVRFLRESPLSTISREGLAWFCIATMFSFLYVTKGGTVDYIFTLAGPAVALMSAGELHALWRRVRGMILPTTSQPYFALHCAARGVIALTLSGIFLIGPLSPPITFYKRLWNQSAFELPWIDPAMASAEELATRSHVAQVKQWITRNSNSDDRILAPPFYAFITQRRLWGDYSEIFIWTIKDKNDRDAQQPEGEGWSKTRAMADALARKEIPIAIIELDQTGRLPEIRAALETHYRPLIVEPYRTLNTRLGVYVPKEQVN